MVAQSSQWFVSFLFDRSIDQLLKSSFHPPEAKSFLRTPIVVIPDINENLKLVTPLREELLRFKKQNPSEHKLEDNCTFFVSPETDEIYQGIVSKIMSFVDADCN